MPCHSFTTSFPGGKGPGNGVDSFIHLYNTTKTRSREKHWPIGSCFTLHFFRALAASCVRNNRQEHSRGFVICQIHTRRLGPFWSWSWSLGPRPWAFPWWRGRLGTWSWAFLRTGRSGAAAFGSLLGGGWGGWTVLFALSRLRRTLWYGGRTTLVRKHLNLRHDKVIVDYLQQTEH